jgi:alanine racemase
MQEYLQQLTRWIEIDTDAIVHNLARIREIIAPRVKILAVVKADAYGLGMEEIARVLVREGVDMLGVTNLEEGMELRRQGIDTPILIFAPILPQQAPLAVEYRLTPSVSSHESLEALAAAVQPWQGPFPIHIKIETGLGRTGLDPEKAGGFIRHILENYPQIHIEGLYTHFARAGAGDRFTRGQFLRFQALLEELKDCCIEIPLRHVCNSAGLLAAAGNASGPGQGGHSSLRPVSPGSLCTGLDLQDPWKVKARVLHAAQFPPGASIGYGRDYILRSGARIAVISMGYADGLAVTAVSRPKNLLDLGKSLVKTFLAYLGKGPSKAGSGL